MSECLLVLLSYFGHYYCTGYAIIRDVCVCGFCLLFHNGKYSVRRSKRNSYFSADAPLRWRKRKSVRRYKPWSNQNSISNFILTFMMSREVMMMMMMKRGNWIATLTTRVITTFANSGNWRSLRQVYQVNWRRRRRRKRRRSKSDYRQEEEEIIIVTTTATSTLVSKRYHYYSSNSNTTCHHSNHVSTHLLSSYTFRN